MTSNAQLQMMDQSGRVPPAQAIYSDLLAVSYPARKRQVEFTASNGDTFDSSKNTIEIPIAIGGAEWIDLSNSYFKITITSKTGAGKTIGFKSPHDIIERLQFLGTNSEMLEDIQNYNNLARMLMFHQLGEDGLTYNTNLGEFQESTLFKSPTAVAGDAAAIVASANVAFNQVTGATDALGVGSHHGQTNFTTKIANDGSITICFPLICGICSTNKYLPLGMLKNRSLTLRVQLARDVKAFTCADDTAPVANYSGVALVADVITMAETYNEKFMNMIRSVGDISIHYTTYKNYADNKQAVNADTTYDGLIPDSSRSLKSLFTIFNKQSEANDTDALQLVNPKLQSYQYTILSETYPQKDVQNVSATNRNQAFANLHIALGQLGSISSRCMGSSESYYASGDTAKANVNSSTFALGVCCESHNKSSNLLESGKNLQNSTQPCRLRAVIHNNNTALSILHYSLSDRLLLIDESGNLRSSG